MEPSGSMAPTAKVGALYKQRAAKVGGVITVADQDGRPRFIWASKRPAASPNATPESAAREHFARFAPAYGLEAGADMQIASVSRTRRGEVVVRLTQTIGGVDVYRGDVKIVMQPDLALIALSGTPADGGVKAAAASFKLAPGQALSRALQDLYKVPVPDALTSTSKAAVGSATWLDLPGASAVTLSEPARARKILYRADGRLTAAYFMEFYSSNGPSTTSDAYSYVVAASDGRVLERRNLTHDVAFNYRVFAEATPEGRPFDGPIADYTPHPAGEPDGTDPAFVLPNLVSIETIKTEPVGVVDPWLPAGSVQSLGNNVDAYADRNSPDGYSNGDLRATTTSAGTFDRIYLTNQEPESTTRQTHAATTNLFYLINWMHDYWYDSGFTEAAGNAQMNNFGRGGVQSDPIKAEAQDFGGLNNANMSTPSDGLSPRMQMFLWTAPSVRSLTIEPGGLDLVNGSAAFGPPEFDVTGEVALGLDGEGPPGDGCTAITSDVAGRIALIDRGTCQFGVKAGNAAAAGAIGVIIANNAPGLPPTMGQSTPPTEVDIPSQSVTLEDGDVLKGLIASGPVTAHMLSAVLGPGRDGSLDNMIVAHEWGHYFHHRLSQCGSTQCGAMSEGWGDFQALFMSVRDGDDLDGTWGAAIYAPKVFGDSAYFGIRRFPYSVDFTRNALSFRHIQNGEVLPSVPTNSSGAPNSEVHNAGEVWASMLFQAYIELQKNPGDRTFAEVQRAFADYVVLGLQLAPIDATFTETRDGILSAVSILNADDLDIIALSFARRGAGSCAESPPRDAAADLAPVVESFDVQPAIQVTTVDLDDSVDSCDLDGILDSGETGQVVVSVANTGPAPLLGSVVTVSSPTPGVVFPDGATASLGDVASFGSGSVAIPIGLDGSNTELGSLELTVTVENPTACVGSVAEVRNLRINADEIAGSSATEDVEASDPPWTRTGAGAEVIWTRAEIDPTSHVWHGNDSGAPTDTQLVSPALEVGDDDFVITFAHAHSFEADTVFWDGGVIEVSTDGGATWQDLSVFADPGYNATITDTSGNVLANRLAYGGNNPSFPEADVVTLDLGTALAGQTVHVRFRIGTDAAVGAPGWTIDNLTFAGITNTPFTTVVAHAGICQVGPVASAGEDRSVASGADVILNGSGSSDPNGDPLTFAWTQTAGTPVTLVNANTANAAFQAPEVSEDAVLTFQVQVSDAVGSSTDTVDITVIADSGGQDDGSDDGTDGTDGSDGAPGPGDGSDDGSGGDNDDDDGCSAAGGAGAGGFPAAMLIGLAFVAVRRRRK